MKKISIAILLMCSLCIATAQNVKELQETAKTFMRQADYTNAILVLNRGLKLEPQNLSMGKDLAMCYLFQTENARAMETINPILDREDTDDQSYQIAGMIYKQADNKKDAEKMYKRGLKKFPTSGPLYNDLGELLWDQRNNEAIKQWEKGIEMDPSFPKNYYNASKYYSMNNDRVWTLLYGEIFINMEPLSSKAPEVKQILLDGYKKLFMDVNILANSKEKNPFTTRYLKNMNEQSSIAVLGINSENLSMIRTRFILSWFNEKDIYSFKLFNYQQQLLQNGLFEAYNQWIFGSSQNLNTYQSWITNHAEENNAFLNFQKGRIFKIPQKEYYR